MTKEEYNKYLHSHHWINFKIRIYKKYKRCRFCHITKNLNIHHLTYKRIGHERNKDVVVVCKPHHFMLHEEKLFFDKRTRSIFDKETFLLKKLGTIAYFQRKTA